MLIQKLHDALAGFESDEENELLSIPFAVARESRKKALSMLATAAEA